MPDEQPTTETTAPAGSADPGTQPGNAPRAFTQDEVNRLVSQARREAKDSALKELSAKTTAAPFVPTHDEPTADRVTMKQLQAQIEDLNLRNAFDKRVAKLDLTDEGADDLFSLYKAQKPTDPAAWFESKAKTFGLRPLTAPTTSATSHAPQEPAPSPAAAPNAPSKVDPLTTGGLVDFSKLTPEQIASLGPQGIREKFEQILHVGRQQSGAPPIPKAVKRA